MKEHAGIGKRICRKYIITATVLLGSLLLAGCGLLGNSTGDSPILDDAVTTEERIDTGFVLTGPDSYDSVDTPVIVDINENDETVTFLNLDINKEYTLSYNGTSTLYDKYGEGISMAQLEEGDIVNIKFLKSKKHLTSLQLASDAWSYENVEKYEINSVRNNVTIGSEKYKLSDNAQYFSEGRRIEEMDLNPSDVLTFNGIGSCVFSVRVDKGHGYLRLTNDENFVGGWIEIGQRMVQRITEDMLLTVPEGSYQVNISNNGGGGIKNVIINRNEETVLDIGDLKVAEAKYGTVLFSLNPSNAKLYIDGSEVDASGPVSLEYGLHQIIAKAAGYSTLTQYIRVGQESAGLDVVMDKADSDSEEESSSESESASEEEATTGYYKVYIDAPEDVEVYLDGNYVGITPCSFRKSAGSHVVTLRKSGYETRSYTIQVDSEDKDISYSFVDLVATGSDSGDTDNDNTEDSGSSDNDSSGNGAVSGNKGNDSGSSGTVSDNEGGDSSGDGTVSGNEGEDSGSSDTDSSGGGTAQDSGGNSGGGTTGDSQDSSDNGGTDSGNGSTVSDTDNDSGTTVSGS